MSLNFEKLKQDCDLYYSKNRELEINFSLEDLAYTWGYTYFDTFSEVIKRVKRPKRFIIFGCSIGYQCFFWNFLFPDIPVIGIDILQHRINWGNSKIDEYSLKNVELFCGDINNFIIQDGDLIWQNDLLISDDVIYNLTLSNISNNDVEIISYNKMSCFVNLEIVNLTDEIILKSDKSYRIVSDNIIGKTSWSDCTDFFIYSKELVKNYDLNNFVFGVEHICKEFMVPEINLKSYDDMNFSKRNVKSEDLRLLYNKYFSKKEFVGIGFNVPELYFYTNKKCDLLKILTKYDSFVAKPAHFSESVDVFIKKGANYNLDIDLVNKKLNDRIDISDKRNWRRRPIDVDIYWKNTERGIILEEYINVKYELKVFVVFGEPLIADLRTGNTELYTIDFIRKDNKYLNWDNEYEIIKEFAKKLKIDFFRIDFLYDGSKLYASELAFMPGTFLPENIQSFILKKWRQPYFEYYYPHLC